MEMLYIYIYIYCMMSISIYYYALIIWYLFAGGRYSISTPAELAKLVVPLVIVGVIFLVMLILLAIFQYQKHRTLCTCLCCRELCNKHQRMHTPSGDPQCACITKNIAKPGTMCEACKKWKNSSGGQLLRSDSQEVSSDGTSSPEVRICRCTINNGCGSVLCKMNNPGLINEKLRAAELSNEKTSGKYLSTEEFLQTAMLNEECNCPCTMGKPLKFPTGAMLNDGFNKNCTDSDKKFTDISADDGSQTTDRPDSADDGQIVSVLGSCGQGANCHSRNGKNLNSNWQSVCGLAFLHIFLYMHIQYSSC